MKPVYILNGGLGMSEKKEILKTSIGGQAIVEGIMMRGPEKTCMAVRTPNGEIILEDVNDKAMSPAKYKKIPILRGIINFISTFILGYKAINRSAELALGDLAEEEETKLDKWLKEKLGEKAEKVIMGITLVFAVLLSVGLFILLPFYTARLIEWIVKAPLGFWFNIAEGVIRIGIFLAYLALVRLMPEMRHLFGYHGAEHKTIHCYEYGQELTVENCREHSRLHKRCGTNFLLIVMIISILMFSLVTIKSAGLRLLSRLVLMPIIAGVSYEVIKLLGRFDNKFTDIISAPGLLLQKLTTFEPDDSQLEVAIKALKEVMPTKVGDDKW